MATSPNYGWSEPDNTDLVKNGALAIRTLGNAIDTSVWNVGFGQAGKNKIINANMAVAQRGTSFTISSTAAYTLDRWRIESAGASTVVTQDAFTPGAAPVAGYESAFAMKLVQAAGGSSNTFIGQRIEDVRTFAGQTVTISFWAKATASKTVEVRLDQNFGSGGSGTAALGGTPQTVTTSWARYSTSITLASLTGKTIGTNSYLDFFLYYNNTAATTISFWGVQVEVGSVATPFQTASGGSIQGELAMCQRYYYRLTPGAGQALSFGNNYNTIQNRTTTMFPVEMRIAPTALEQNGTANNYAISQAGIGSTVCSNVPSFGIANTRFATVTGQVASGLTAYNTSTLSADATNGATAYLGWSAEL